MFLENGFVLEFCNFNIKVLFLLWKLIFFILIKFIEEVFLYVIFLYWRNLKKVYKNMYFNIELKNGEKVLLFSKMINFFKICIVIGRCFIIWFVWDFLIFLRI